MMEDNLSKFLHVEPNGKPHLNINKLVKTFLIEHPVVRNNGSFYSYIPEKGIWKREDSIDDVRKAVAKYMETNVKWNWSNRFKEDTNEILKMFTETIEEMNVSDVMICTENAVINVETGESFPLEEAKQYYFTTSIPVVYDRSAKCPKFRDFLSQVCCGNKKRQNSLIEFMGLILTKKINDVALVCVGTGANGKSVYANICCSLLGEDNYTSILLNDLPTFGTGKLPGKRLATMSEISPKDSQYLMTTEMKQIITGELMNCNEKYKKMTDFRPYVKVLILSNHMIGLAQDSSDGATRRFLVIPFELRIPKEERDINLEAKLKEEMSGILNLALKGYQKLKKDNFIYASQSESDIIIKDIIRHDNPFLGFMKDRLYFEANAHVLYCDLANAYREWKRENGITEYEDLNGSYFRKMLKQYGTVEGWRSNGNRGLEGVRLINK